MRRSVQFDLPLRARNDLLLQQALLRGLGDGQVLLIGNNLRRHWQMAIEPRASTSDLRIYPLWTWGFRAGRNDWWVSDNGCLRSDPHFQICAAPASAPKPEQTIADHPFVFEFPLAQSSDAFITSQRKTRKTLEWTWFLNAVLRTRIKAIGPRADYHWSLCMCGNDALTQANIKWAQEFYTIDNFRTQDDGFSACDEPHVAKIPFENYYAADVYRWDEFVVPDNLDALIEAFANLKPEDRFRFLRACQWVYVAYAHWVTHASSFYIALVAAIESLLPAAPKSERCPECGRDKGPGPTQLFHDFVEAHTKSETASNRKPLYALRSKLAHGLGLLQLDERPWAFSFNTSALQERESWTELYNVVREVLINWLLKHGH